MTSTPCIGVCSTTYGDDVCRGCGRYWDEVVSWQEYSEDQKKDVWYRIEQASKWVLGSYLSLRPDTEDRVSKELLEVGERVPKGIGPWTAVLRYIRATGHPPSCVDVIKELPPRSVLYERKHNVMTYWFERKYG